jgi:hypothetical protein
MSLHWAGEKEQRSANSGLFWGVLLCFAAERRPHFCGPIAACSRIVCRSVAAVASVETVVSTYEQYRDVGPTHASSSSGAIACQEPLGDASSVVTAGAPGVSVLPPPGVRRAGLFGHSESAQWLSGRSERLVSCWVPLRDDIAVMSEDVIMSNVILDINMSLDGLIAQPDDAPADPRVLLLWRGGARGDLQGPRALDRGRQGVHRRGGGGITGRRAYDLTTAWEGNHPMPGAVLRGHP